MSKRLIEVVHEFCRIPDRRKAAWDSAAESVEPEKIVARFYRDRLSQLSNDGLHRLVRRRLIDRGQRSWEQEYGRYENQHDHKGEPGQGFVYTRAIREDAYPEIDEHDDLYDTSRV